MPNSSVSSQPGAGEVALQESLDRLRPIIESSPHGIFIKDLKGRYVQVNQALAQSLRLPKDQILGRTAEDVLPAQVAAAIQAEDLQTLVSPTGVDVA
jgi:PAS domain S-box-containing protein